MKSRSLQILTASSWAALCVCAAALFYLAIAIPNVFSVSTVADRDKSVQEIRAATNLQQVQQVAVWRTQEEAYITQSTRILLIISVSALLVCLICSGANLFLAGRLKAKARAS
jgi:hypothetical protein